MFGLGDWIKLGIGVIAGLGFGFLTGNIVGDRHGYERAKVENRQAAFEQMKERAETDARVDDLSDADLCGLIGGVWRDGRCG